MPTPGAQDAEREPGETLPQKSAAAGSARLCSYYLIALNTGFNTRGLDAAMSSEFPVKAVNFLRQNPQPGPLYNTFDWGGFLTWYMPDYPVAIDGRTDLYGDELDFLFFNSERGDDSYVRRSLSERGEAWFSWTKNPLATFCAGINAFRRSTKTISRWCSSGARSFMLSFLIVLSSRASQRIWV